jgi:uncharacterized Zn finger protein (UPF0148 family)
MPDKDSTLEVTCPCCGTWLKVDIATSAVLLEKRPKAPLRSFEEAVAAEMDRGRERDSAFRKAFTTIETEKEILEKKMREAMKKAKEEKDKPLPPRPIDLD